MYLCDLSSSGVYQKHQTGWKVAQKVDKEDNTNSEGELVLLLLPHPDLLHVVQAH